MTIKRLDHISVVVDDLAAALDFFTTLGMTIEGKAAVEGPWVDRVNGLEGVQVDIVMMRRWTLSNDLGATCRQALGHLSTMT
jgi:catechol 2,3-dioxygenase-like lactoylglutathione lyase family enzyme